MSKLFLGLNPAIVSPYLCAHIQIPLSDFMMMMPHMITYSNRVIEKESMKAYLCFIYIEQLHQDTASIVHDTNDGNYSCRSKDGTDGIIVLSLNGAFAQAWLDRRHHCARGRMATC